MPITLIYRTITIKKIIMKEITPYNFSAEKIEKVAKKILNPVDIYRE